MKCKFGIVSIMLAGLALTATAQTKEKYYSEKFKDNIFISAGVGAQACVILITLIMALDMPSRH